MTLITMVTVSILMFLYQKLFSKILGKWGSQREKFATKSLKSLNEIFGGIKTIKMSRPIIGGGYQYHLRELYFNGKYQVKWPTGNSNFTYNDGINFGLGYVW